MDTLPVIAGIMTAASALLLVFSFIAYRRTGMKRILLVSLISGTLLVKGLLLFADMADVQKFTYEVWAGLDLITVMFLLLMLFGKA